MLDLRRREQRRRRQRLAIIAVAAVVVIGASLSVGLVYLFAGPDSHSVNVSISGITETSRVSTTSTTLSAAAAITAAATSTPASTTTSMPPSTTVSMPPSTTVSAPLSTTVSAPLTTTTSTEPPPRPVLAFDSAQAMAHVEKLAAEIGVRRGGTEAEDEAARYAVDCLNGFGYEAVMTDVPVPNGLTSHNVIAVRKGSSPLTVVVGGHMDSKKPAPGGNDNASGAAAVLELARDVKDADITPTVVFVLFGNEEMIDTNKDHHHYGSRAYVQQMTAADRANVVAMISLDMVGYGDTFTIRTMGEGPRTLGDMLQSYAGAIGVSLTYLKDPSSFGYSDHEPFELAGYPAVWLEWREDPLYHTAGDTYEHCNAARIQEAGDLVLGFLAALEPSDLEDLQAAKY